MLFNFLLLPFVINRIGLKAFGTTGLMLSVLAPLTLIGTVLGQAMLREISSHLSVVDLRSGQRSFSAAISMCFAGCLLVGLVFLGLGKIIISLVTDEALTNDYQLCIFAAIVGWSMQQFVLIFQSAIAATQKYRLLAVISIISSLFNAACVVGIVMYIPTAFGYLAGLAMGFSASAIIWLLLIKRYEPWLFPLCWVSKADYRAIIDFGKWQSISQFVGGLGLQMDRYVLGAFSSAVFVGQYNVAMRLQEVVHMGILKAGEVLFPHFSSTSHHPAAQRASFFISVSWLMNTFAASALAPLIPLSWHIIALWVNQEAATGGATMLSSLTVAGILGCAVNVYHFHTMGIGDVFRLTQLTFITAILTVVFTFIFILNFGPLAAGIGVIVGNGVRLVFVIFFSKKSFESFISLRTLILVTMPPLLAGLLVAYAWDFSGILTPSTWPLIVVDYVLVSACVAIASIVMTSISAQGRHYVLASARAARKFLKV
jgi:O-antigen/teichoic acid export membrane protein